MISRLIRDVKKYYRYMLYSARAQLKNEVAGSFLSKAWWVLDPLLFMLVYTFVYSIVFGRSVDYLCAFIFVGYAAWTFFNRTVNQSCKLIRKYKSVLSKVYLPKFVLVLTQMMVNGFKMAISFGIVFVAMALYRVPLTAHFLCIIPLILLLFLLTFAVSSLLLHFGVFINDLANLVNVGLRLMFYLSGIFYSINLQIAPSHPRLAYLMIRLNPMSYIITMLRDTMLYGHGPLWKWYALWFAGSLAVALLGVALMYKYERRYVKTI